VKPKKVYLIFGSLLIVGLLVVGGYEGIKAYDRSFATLNDQGVDLNAYRPFANGTKAVKLAEPSTFTIKDNPPKLDGATALYPLYAAFAQAVYPANREYDLYNSPVMSTNTVNAYERLLRGEADIIFTAQPSQQQLSEAKLRGMELKLTPIGREAFVFFVQAENPVKGLSTQQIQAIYSGTITNWSELGGSNSAIRAFQRPENSGSQTMLQRLMKGQALMKPPTEDIARGMGGIIAQTADYRNYPNAIGYSFLYFATEMIKNGEIRLLQVDGVVPDRNSIKSGAYPLTTDFYAVTAGLPHPQVEPFIQWILSEQGQRLVEQTGYTEKISKHLLNTEARFNKP
jgi:phosphate transport system substrate-binding protein